MGIDTSAFLVYGTKIKSKAFKNVINKIRGCHHDIDENQKFCPQCGSPVFITKERLGLYDLPTTNAEYYDMGMSIPQVPVYAFYNEGSEEVVIGVKLGSIYEHSDEFSNKINEIQNKDAINKSIVEFCKTFNADVDTNKLDFGSFLMWKYS